jgi:lipoprotein-anchoring transpeptidase ErfK/SrfK
MLSADTHPLLSRIAIAAVASSAVLASTVTLADPLGFAGSLNRPLRIVEQIAPESGSPPEIRSSLERRVVHYPTRESPGTIVIDTPNTSLYLVVGGGRAIRYGIGVGREGFTWSGVRTIDRKVEWPDWIPPAEMLGRQPYLPRFMAGGPGNPLGARALYLGGTVYRIHGTNDPSTIGKRVSSGCIRMLNNDVIDLYAHVNIGTKVVVLPMQPARALRLAAQDRSIPRPVRTAAANASRASGF